jgi:hypothetical protein
MNAMLSTASAPAPPNSICNKAHTTNFVISVQITINNSIYEWWNVKKQAYVAPSTAKNFIN